MKIKNALIFLGVFSLKTLDHKENTQITYTEEEQKLLNKLFDEYKPTPKRCGPAIQQGVEGYTESLPNKSVEAGLTCLLSGYKNVFMGGNIKEISKPMKQVLSKNKISYFCTPNTSIEECIYYTPKGKLYASLLLKYGILNYLSLLLNNEISPSSKNQNILSGLKLNQNLDIVNGCYIDGHLLGYDDVDILAFYNHIGKKFNRKNQQEKFENDRKSSLEWIKRNEADINEWIKDNSLKYDIQNIDF